MSNPAILAVAILLFGVSAIAQQGGSSDASGLAPTSAPATQRAPYRVTMPPGFVKLTGDGVFGPRTVICATADVDWVKAALAPGGPATRPTTMPSDVLADLSDKRAALIARISDDLAMTDTAAVGKAFDSTVVSLAEQLSSVQPTVIFMVTDRAQLDAALQGGWQTRQFSWNRLASEPVLRGNPVNLAVDHPLDDTLFPLLYDSKEAPADRTTSLSARMRAEEIRIAENVSSHCQAFVQSRFASLAGDLLSTVITPPNSKDSGAISQQWFYVGLVTDCATRWMAMTSGMDGERMLADLSTFNPNNPIRASSLDMLHPPPLDSIRQEALLSYMDAFRRRALFIFDDWLRRAGPGALHKTIAALRTQPPADGAALLKGIQQASGIDLTAELAPQD